MVSATPTSLPDGPAPRTILVVDDDRLIRRTIVAALKPGNFNVIEAESGERALQLYDETPPDLVLLDVVLPGINGFETCRRLRRFHGEHAAPIIFITSKNEPDDVVEGLSAGGVDYLLKPVHGREALARVHTHLQIRELMARQRQLVEQLSNANAAKNKFLGMAAHDLRTPLASIRGLAEFLRDGAVGPVTSEQRDLITTICTASHEMLHMVNELLDVATIEAGELRAVREPADLADLVDKTVSLKNIDAARKQTRIIVVAAARPSRANLDPAKIRQVIDNLLSNAVKFSPPGSIITVELNTTTDGHVVAVRDQGPGIPESERHRLFKDFGRTSVKPTGGEKSTGLGLAICRKIIEAHQGSISAENLPAGGCVFRVFLPR